MFRPLLLSALTLSLAAAESASRAPVTLQEALLSAMEHNQQLRVQRFTPDIAATAIDNQRAAFDPRLTGTVSRGRAEAPGAGGTAGGITQTTRGELAVETYLPTGTGVSVGAQASRSEQTWTDTAYAQTRAGVSVNQALLKGFGLDVNLAGIRQARLDADISQYELRGYVTALVSNVERGYWDLCLAQEQVAIVERSLAIAKQRLEEAKTLVRVGKIAEVELIAAEAEVAARLGNQIDALAARDAGRINLLRLMNPAGPQALTGELTLAEKPFVPAAGAGPVEEHVAVALRLRPDLNQAKLQYQRGQLELVQTRNGLLPQLDLFVSLGRTGYADSFGGSFKGETAKGWDATVGLNLGYTFGNREANATQRRSQLSTEQRKEALKNQQQLAEADVRLAHLEINRTRQQIDATAASSRLQNAKAKVEHEKLRVGSSTTLLVAQVDRDVLAAELAAISAVASHLKALIDLYRLDGSLLDRRSLSAPGTQSVETER